MISSGQDPAFGSCDPESPTRPGRVRLVLQGSDYARPPCHAAFRPARLVFALLLGLAACGGSKSQADGPADDESAIRPSPPARRIRGARSSPPRRCPRSHVYETSPDTARDRHRCGVRRRSSCRPSPARSSTRPAWQDRRRLHLRQPDLLQEPVGVRGHRGRRRVAEGAAAGAAEPHRGLDPAVRRDPERDPHPHRAGEVVVPPQGLGRRSAGGRDRRGDRQGPTYTPVGTFYIAEKIAKTAGGAYGPWILALNGYSESLDSFDGGMPQLAFHGTTSPS